MAPHISSQLTGASEDADGPVVRVRGLRKAFGDDQVLDGIDLDIHAREVVALVGRSGSGKSTLLRVLAGLDPDHQGEATVAGTPAVAFQEPRLLPWKRVRANVTLGLRGRDVGPRVDAALEEVGLSNRRDAWPLTLSGGEAQRVSLARALVREPSLLLLDEPFGALDALTRLSMHELVFRLWARHGLSILLVTHDVDEAVRLADRVLVLEDGRIASEMRVSAPRPRPRGDRGLADLTDLLLYRLGVPRPGTPDTTSLLQETQ